MSIIRSIMRGIARNRAKQNAAGSVTGAVRAGMHQKAEHEYRRRQMAEALPPEEESVEAGLEMPASVEAEIPPAEEEDDEIVEEIATEEAAVSGDEEILEEIAAPQAEIEEETAAVDELETEQLSVDYSTEKIPVFDPIISGSVDPSTPLEYSSQGGEVKEIQEPLPGMERMGVEPYIPGEENPSGNVPAADDPQDLHIDY